ncbi:unnamed protein product [Mucor hiemalis]
MLKIHQSLLNASKTWSRCYSTVQLLREWENHTKATCNQTTYNEITPSQFNLLANTLNDSSYVNANTPKINTVLPPCWHHVYFPPRTLESDLADNGYETEYFPPKPFSQRMWVGAQMTWNLENPLKVGDTVKMETGLDHAELRQGRLGDSAMVWINKDIENQHGWSMREQRCLVYHQEQKEVSDSNGRGLTARKEAQFSRTMTPSSILLFRYSALTFNSHKIHFDHEYATQVEKHPACLVHGPLSGTLLLDLLRTQEKSPIRSFEYKCLAPLYVNRPLTLSGRKSTNERYDLWITNDNGHLVVKGSAHI